MTSFSGILELGRDLEFDHWFRTPLRWQMGCHEGHAPIQLTALPAANSLQLRSQATFGHLLPASVSPQVAQCCPALGSSSTCSEAVDGSPATTITTGSHQTHFQVTESSSLLLGFPSHCHPCVVKLCPAPRVAQCPQGRPRAGSAQAQLSEPPQGAAQHCIAQRSPGLLLRPTACMVNLDVGPSHCCSGEVKCST